MSRRPRSKTVTAWLAFAGGPLGLWRFYLRGLGDWIGWAVWIPTLLGAYGCVRIQQYGVDDVASWFLVPLLGLTIAATSLVAIVYGLMTPEKWNASFNPREPSDAPAGNSQWLTIFAIVAALMVGTGCLMATLAFSFFNYFNAQVEEGRRISE